jgi:hypothetical protein
MLLVCTRADRSAVDSVTIYQSASSSIQDTCLQAFDPNDYRAHFDSSPSGSASHDLDLAWLNLDSCRYWPRPIELHTGKYCDNIYSPWLDSLKFSRCSDRREPALPGPEHCQGSSAENDVEHTIPSAVRILLSHLGQSISEDLTFSCGSAQSKCIFICG